MAFQNKNSTPVGGLELIDSHCHLDLLEDPAKVWQQCRDVGVNGLIIPGTESQQWPRLRQLSEDLNGVYWGAGIHPWWAKSRQEPERNTQGYNQESLPNRPAKLPQLQQLHQEFEQQSQHRYCVAIGECGLDKGRDHWQQQQQLCESQISIACDLKLPLILHCHKAHNDLIKMLIRYQPLSGGVIHGFSGSIELAQQYIKLGFLIGIGATVSYQRAKKTISTLKQLPQQALLLETDAPSMPLQGHQGQVNSPAFLPKILQCVAAIRGQSTQEVATISNTNCRQLFTKIQ